MGFFGFPGFSCFLARRAAARKLAKTKKNKEIQRKTKKNKEIRRKTKNTNDTGHFEKFRENSKISRKIKNQEKQKNHGTITFSMKNRKISKNDTQNEKLMLLQIWSTTPQYD